MEGICKIVVGIGWTYIFFTNKMQVLEYLEVSFIDALYTDP